MKKAKSSYKFSLFSNEYDSHIQSTACLTSIAIFSIGTFLLSESIRKHKEKSEIKDLAQINTSVADNPPEDYMHDYDPNAPKHFSGYECRDCQIVWKDYYGEHKDKCPYCNSDDITSIMEC